MSLISNSGHDENNRYSGGKAGDQTGTEWYLRSWYNRPWNCVLRHPDEKVRAKIAELGIKAAKNDNIGYDQYQRTTYWTQLQKVGYDPSKIKTPCEADCSAGVMANVKATGYLLGIGKLKNVPITSTYYMRSILKNAGFQVLTASKYLTSADYLMKGDILLNDNAHTATNIETGKYANESTTKDYWVRGDSGETVEEIQKMLNTVGGYGLKVDGSFGKLTEQAVIDFQGKNGLETDGSCGKLTMAKLKEKYEAKTNKGNASYGSATPSKTPKWVGKSTVDGLNVRTWAGTDNQKLKSYPKLNKGNLVDVCDTVKDNKSEDWYYVRIAGKIFGFVKAEFIAKA